MSTIEESLKKMNTVIEIIEDPEDFNGGYPADVE